MSDEPVQPGDWRVFGAALPSQTRIITPEGELLLGVVDATWSQSADGISELSIVVRPAVIAASSTEPPTIRCDRCQHEHRCETAEEAARGSLMAALGGRPSVYPGGPAITPWAGTPT